MNVLNEACNEITEWRKTKKSTGEKTPQSIIDKIIELSDKISPSKIAKVLNTRLDFIKSHLNNCNGVKKRYNFKSKRSSRAVLPH